jgi:hypothetical protein
MKQWRVVRRDHTVYVDSKGWVILDRNYGPLHKREVAAHIDQNGEVSWYLGHIKLKTKEIVAPKRRWEAKIG